MPMLFNHSQGRWQWVQGYKVKENVLAGTHSFGRNSKVRLRSGDEFHEVEGKDIADALAAGAEYDTRYDERQRYLKKEYDGSHFQAFAAGGARGLALGSDVILRGMGMRNDQIQALAQHNPAASFAGEIVGGALPALAAPGLGITGAAARLTPAGLAAFGAAKTGGAVAGGVQRLMAKRIGSEIVKKYTAGAVGLGVAGAIEAGAMAAGSSFSAEALGDPDTTSEKLMTSIGYSAAVGGAFGVGLATLGAAARLGLRGTPWAIDKIYEKTVGSKPLKGLGDRVARNSAARRGVDPDIAAEAYDVTKEGLKTKAEKLRRRAEVEEAAKRIGPEAADAIDHGNTTLKKITVNIQGDTNSVLKAMDGLTKLTRGSAKVRAVTSKISGRESGNRLE